MSRAPVCWFCQHTRVHVHLVGLLAGAGLVLRRLSLNGLSLRGLLSRLELAGLDLVRLLVGLVCVGRIVLGTGRQNGETGQDQA